MKRIKKTLCLMLVLALALGMVPAMSATTAVALEFEDADDIKNVEAASVLNALGIIVGDSTGFRPDDTINRAEAATIITRMLVGTELAKIYEESTASSHFTDVSSSQWWSGVIMFAYERGIMHGTNVSHTRFSPRGTLTIPQFAIMLMRALGKATTNDYLDNNWIADALTDAMKLGLLDGVTAEKLTDDATRDIAAQMALNAIFVGAEEVVTRPAQFYIWTAKDQFDSTETTPPGVDGSHAVNELSTARFSSRLEALVAAQAVGGTFNAALSASAHFIIKEIVENKETRGGIAQTIFNVTRASSFDVFGRPTVEYKKGTSAAFHVQVVPYVTQYASTVTQGALYTALGLSASNNVLKSFLNGTSGADLTVASGGTTNVTNAANGRLTQIYRDGGGYRIVQIDIYAAEITDVTGTTAAGNRKVVLDNLTGPLTTPADYATSSFAKDDIVLFTFADGKIQDMWKAKERLEATVSSTSGVVNSATAASNTGSFISGGQTYRFNTNNNNKSLTNLAAHATRTHDFFLDDNDFVVYARPFSAAAAPLEYLWVDVAASAGLGRVEARVLFADGKVDVVTVTHINTVSATVGSGANQIVETGNQIFSYTTTDNVNYRLTSVASGSQGTVTSTSNQDVYISGTATIAAGTGSDPAHYANPNTKFVIGTVSGGFTVYTGTLQTPTISSTTTNNVNIRYVRNNNLMTVVFVIGGNLSGAASSRSVVIMQDGKTTHTSLELGNYTEYLAVVNGEIGVVRRANTTAMNDGAIFTAGTDGLFSKGSYDLNADFFYTSTQITGLPQTTATGVVFQVTGAYNNGRIWLNDGAAYVGVIDDPENVKVFRMASSGITVGDITNASHIQEGDIVVLDWAGAAKASSITAIYVFSQTKRAVAFDTLAVGDTITNSGGSNAGELKILSISHATAAQGIVVSISLELTAAVTGNVTVTLSGTGVSEILALTTSNAAAANIGDTFTISFTMPGAAVEDLGLAVADT